MVRVALLVIIVYGNYLESLTVINVLLENNIDGSRIVYVRLNYMDSLFSNEFVSNLDVRAEQYNEGRFERCFFCQNQIAKAVHDELQKQGVRVFKRFNFDSWRLNKNKTKIERVTFKSDKKNLEINCAGLFWFDRKRIQDINRLCKRFFHYVYAALIVKVVFVNLTTLYFSKLLGGIYINQYLISDVIRVLYKKGWGKWKCIHVS